MNVSRLFSPPRPGRSRAARAPVLTCVLGTLLLAAPPLMPPVQTARAQTLTPEMLAEASRRTGLSEDELRRQYETRNTGSVADEVDETIPGEPGRTSLDGVDDRYPVTRWRDTEAQVILPLSETAVQDALAEAIIEDARTPAGQQTFGTDFFRLDEGVFQPPSFGPVSGDYRLGVGDELVINAWGEIDFQLVRVIDRDGAIILPRSGKVVCAGRTLAAAERSIRDQLARSHSSIAAGDDADPGTQVEVTLGRLRSIRVFVIGRAVRPGSYELSSASSVLTALYASGGPNELGTFRDIRLMRGAKQVARLDLYAYLTAGKRDGDALLQEGDTIFIPDRERRVHVEGPVRRPMYYEMTSGESLDDLIDLAGGFTPQAALETVHVKRVLAPVERRPGEADHVLLDVILDPATGKTASGGFELRDGDAVTVDVIADRLDAYVEIQGAVKRPGRYEFHPGVTAVDLIALAGGLWPDALTETAVIDRTTAQRDLVSVNIRLADQLAGRAAPEVLQARDVLHVFDRWEIQQRPQVHISGEVNAPGSLDWRRGMTLRDLVLKSGGLKDSANLMQAEVSRLRLEAVASRDITSRPEHTVDVIPVQLGEDFLTREAGFELQAYDRVAIRRLPWWELQQTVTVRGDVFYPGVFSLERRDERLSSVIGRAGGLTPDAYAIGARVVRTQDGVGNIAIDLALALEEPGSEHDIILQAGDQIIVPDRMFTVKIVGEVGFPTSLVYEEGKKINWYVDRAGGYLEQADKGKTRVVWPNGMSLPNKGGSKVVAGSTIVVPVEPPPEGATTLETLREISGILAGLATVWLVIDRTN